MTLFLSSFIITFSEVCYFDAFFHITFESRIKAWHKRIFLLFLPVMAVCFLSPYYPALLKTFFVFLMLVLYMKTVYDVSWSQSIFFSLVSYILAFLTEMAFVLFVVGFGFDLKTDSAATIVASCGTSLINIMVILFFKKKMKLGENIRLFIWRDWVLFAITPLLSFVCMLYMYHELLNDHFRRIYGYASIILYVVNIVMMVILVRTLQDKEALRIAAVKENDARNRLEYYRDMQALSRRQGKKLHDYKNQLLTIQDMLKSGNYEKAVHFTENLTESISMEMSAVNTNHPVMNAVLNQKYRTAKDMGIQMVFTVGDLREIGLTEEEIVILTSNLLDNAIRECEKQVKAGEKALIIVKAVYENGQFEFHVKNPVRKRVEIRSGNICAEEAEGQGIGLTNVRDVVERHDGSFALTCDEKEFTASVIL